MRYRAIQEHGRRDSIRLMCRALRLRVIYRESRETYGSPSLWDALVKQGHRIGEHRLARLMCQDGIRAKTVKMWRAPNQSQYRFLVAENTLDRRVRIESQIGCGQETSPSCSICTRAA